MPHGFLERRRGISAENGGAPGSEALVFELVVQPGERRARLLGAFEAGERDGAPIKVIYHSHCDAGAYFSAEDAATFASDGQLMWPCAFIVVSVREGKLQETKLWVHVPGTDQFRESTLTVR